MGERVHCVKLNREAEGLDFAPWPGALGERLLASVSKEAWQEWMAHQTRLINEQQLNPMERSARKYLAQQAEAWFFGGEVEQPEGFIAPGKQE
ncbi:MAG: oxidative damage protection protein [Acidiferrobacteraceae bacterium]|nr:oxidative damage protection protein [Acidiferrobacteraceae bacterium]MDP6434812.1 oxidative damage protection protein [Arenicellales bacterium]MDP6672977.1 oxidative damage protection protein [Arenicellales bacterium]MDP6724133.1 oxidative damage protection protein [Arenicellales bacterium]